MKVGIIGEGRRGLGGRMLAMLAAGFGQVARYSGKAPAVSASYRDSKGKLRFSWPISPRSSETRHWHNPADPVQAARIQAAVDKRERKAKKLFNQASYSADQNRAHYDESDNLRDNLNPFYIAK